MAAAAKVRTGAAKGLTRSADIKLAVAAVQHVPAHIRPAVRRHIMRKAKGIKGAARHIPQHWHPSGAIRHVRPAQALALAEAAGVTLDLANDLNLAGKWKHGWIPLDAVAAAVKAKRYHGGATHEVSSHSGPIHVRNVRGDANNRNMAIATVVKDHRKGTASTHAPGESVWVAKAQVRPLGPPSKGRAGSAVEARREPSRGRVKGALPTRGQTFSDAGDSTLSRREHGLPTGGRKAAKVTPVGARLEHGEPRYVVPADHAAAARAAIRMKAPELRKRAGNGDKIAQAELDRRAARRTGKNASVATGHKVGDTVATKAAGKQWQIGTVRSVDENGQGLHVHVPGHGVVHRSNEDVLAKHQIPAATHRAAQRRVDQQAATDAELARRGLESGGTHLGINPPGEQTETAKVTGGLTVKIAPERDRPGSPITGHNVIVEHPSVNYPIAGARIDSRHKTAAERRRIVADAIQRGREHLAGRPKADAPPAGSGAGGGEPSKLAAARAAIEQPAVNPEHVDALRAAAEAYQRRGYDASGRPVASDTGADVSRETSQAGIRIEHSGDGTLVHGTERGDKDATAALKANGFKWSSNLGAWYLPRNWSESTRAAKVNAVQSALGDRVTVDRGSVAKSTTAAERAAERTRRDAELAAAHTAQAGKLSAEADRRFGAARAIGDHIPFGQPILVGHHSEGRHRRDLARIDSNMRAGVAAHRASEGAAHRAGEAAARVKLATNPQALSRRIERNSAELRRLDRILNGTGKAIHGQDKPHPPGEHRDRLEAMRAELADSIEHDRQTVAAAGAPQHGPATVRPGDYVRIKGSLLRVEKSNPKTITVKSHGLTLKYPYSDIQAHDTTENLLSKASDTQLQAFIYSKRGTPEAAAAQRILDERKRQAD